MNQQNEELESLLSLEKETLIFLILDLRKAIRYHRDQKGDDRCWLDDIKLYESLPERPDVDLTLPSRQDFLVSCEKFFDCRQGKAFRNADDCYDSGSYRSINAEKEKT